MNLIRYGKIKDGVEHDVKSGYSDYDSTQEAVSRALALIEAKQSNGYILDSPESKRLILKSPIKTPVKNRFTNLMSVKDNFDGVYLELELDNRILFWKIQASGPSIKIDIGVDGKLEKTDFNRFDSDEEAAKMVKLKV